MIDSPGCDNFPHPHASTGCSICEPWALESYSRLHPRTQDFMYPDRRSYGALQLAHAVELNPRSPWVNVDGIQMRNPLVTND